MDYILASVCQRNGAKTVTVERSLGSQPAREKREINTRHRQRGEERNQWHLFSLLIAFCFLLRTAGKVSLRAWTEISLSFHSPVSSLHLSLFLSLPLSFSLSVISSLSGVLISISPLAGHPSFAESWLLRRKKNDCVKQSFPKWQLKQAHQGL